MSTGKKRLLQRAVLVLFGLQVVALFTSIAMMEMVSWTLFLLAVVLFVIKCKEQGVRSGLLQLSLGAVNWVLLFFFLGVMLSLLHIPSRSEQFYVFGSLRWILLVYGYTFLLKEFFSTQWEKGMALVFAMATISGGYSLLQAVTGHNIFRPQVPLPYMGHFFRATGFFNLPLTYAYSLGLAGFVILSYAVLVRSRHYKWGAGLSALAFAMVVLGLIASQTRGAWLALAVGVVVFAWPLGKKIFTTLGVSLGLFAVVLLISFPSLRHRVASSWNVHNASNVGRFQIWQANWAMFKAHPFIGVGLTHNEDLAPQYYKLLGITNGFVGHAHNNFLQFLSGTGLIGFAGYMVLIVYFLWLSWSLWKRLPKEDIWWRSLALGAFAAQVYLHVGGLTEVNFTDGEVNHLLIFIWSFLLVIDFLRRKNEATLETSRPV